MALASERIHQSHIGDPRFGNAFDEHRKVGDSLHSTDGYKWLKLRHMADGGSEGLREWICSQWAKLVVEHGMDDHDVEMLSVADFADKIKTLRERPAGHVQEPLTDSQQQAFEYIKANQPVSGKEIVKALELSSESTFTRHYVPALKKHGVKNKPRAGYYIA